MNTPLDEVVTLKNTGWQVLKLTNGYLRYLRDRKLGSSLELRETSQPGRATSDDDESMEWLEELLEQHPDLLPSTKQGSDYQPLI